MFSFVNEVHELVHGCVQRTIARETERPVQTYLICMRSRFEMIVADERIQTAWEQIKQTFP